MSEKAEEEWYIQNFILMQRLQVAKGKLSLVSIENQTRQAAMHGRHDKAEQLCLSPLEPVFLLTATPAPCDNNL
jgi:hypothetical protein